MCGIYGITSPVKTDEIIKNLDCLTHRGPDDSGLWHNRSGNMLLGHRRLSILDLSATGHQPMVSDCGRFGIVLNGEVYNYLELKKILEAEGYFFKGSGDTEVVLTAYRKWGFKCVERFNGMFALAIYEQEDDGNPKQLFIARDRAGKKPFYYRHKGEMFEFASELKALSGAHSIGAQALNHYLALGYVPFDYCIVKGIKKLPPAHAGVFDLRSGDLNVWRYWQLPTFVQAEAPSLEEAAEESWELLKNSVSLRLRSDVPVGVFLSGGLDSSLITAAAAEVAEQAVKTFTIAVPGSKLDETAHARLIADHFGSEHHVLELQKPSLDVIDELAPFVDEPLADSSILPTFLVSKLTAPHVKVALGGDGGDEVYGGYRHYQQALLDKGWLGRIPVEILDWTARLAAMLPAGIRGRNRLASLRSGAEYAHIWGTPYFDVELRKRILHPDIVRELGDELDRPERTLLGLMSEGRDVVDSLMRTDFQSVLPDDFLVKVDRASMANSLEVRSPFLDYRLVENAFRHIPSVWKVTSSERRRIQNVMAKRYLPNNYELNRKQGFSIPMDEWLRRGDIQGRLDLLPNFINKAECERLVKGQIKGRTNGARLFALMMLAISQQNLCGGNRSEHCG